MPIQSTEVAEETIPITNVASNYDGWDSNPVSRKHTNLSCRLEKL